MFDITSSKLLILGIVALLVIGPKDLPALLRTIGKYMGIIKRQAADFRAQFDEAMRESELAASSRRRSRRSAARPRPPCARPSTPSSKELADARQDVDAVMVDEPKPAADADAFAHDANLLPAPGTASTGRGAACAQRRRPSRDDGRRPPPSRPSPRRRPPQAAQAADTKTGERSGA